MTSRYEALMNGIALSSIDPTICVLDIRYNTANLDTSTTGKAAGHGMFVGRRRIETASVRIDAEIHEYSTWKRQEICQRIAAWAKAGKLETNDRPDQFLNVVCQDPPTIQTAKHWTDPVTITFTAYEIPYWQKKYPTTAEITDTGTLFVPGNIDKAPVNAEIKASSKITSLTLNVGSTSITLSGINIAANSPVYVTHDEHGYLAITNKGNSLLAYRTGDDDLMAECGGNVAVSCTANVTATCKFSTYGGWY